MEQQKKTNVEIFDRTSKDRIKIRTQFRGHIPYKETNTEPSQTIPGMDLSIGEMLRRTQAGLPISGQQIPVYNGERLLPNWKSLDLIDRQNVISEAKANVDKQKKSIENQKAAIVKKRDEFIKQQMEKIKYEQDVSKTNKTQE